MKTVNGMKVIEGHIEYAVRFHDEEQWPHIIPYDTLEDAQASAFIFSGEVVESHHFYTEWLPVDAPPG